MQSRNRAHPEIRGFRVPRAEGNCSRARKVTGVHKERHGIDNIQILILLVNRLKAAFCQVLALLFDSVANVVLRIPWLVRDTDKISPSDQVAETVVTLVFGLSSLEQDEPSLS